MKNKNDDNRKLPAKPATPQQADQDGYPLYPVKEDIYQQLTEEKDIDPENPTKKKPPIAGKRAAGANEKSFADDEDGDDLDVPGAAADDADEEIGSEDEENNYYSLGGDDHNDLEESKE